MNKSKLLFPKDVVGEKAINDFPMGTSTLTLSLPAGQKREWVWTNGKHAYIVNSEAEKITKDKDGKDVKTIEKSVFNATAGQFYGHEVIKGEEIESPMLCVRTSRHIAFKCI